MKKPLIILICFVIWPLGLDAQQKLVLSTAAASCPTTNTSCLLVTVDPSQGGATFTISLNGGGNTIQFEASGDYSSTNTANATWVALNVFPSNSSTAVTSTTSTGVWQANIAGYTAVRMRMSTQASGNTTVSLSTSFASALYLRKRHGGVVFTPAFQSAGNCHTGATSCTMTLSVTSGWFAVCAVNDSTVSTPFSCSDTNSDSFTAPTSSPFLGSVTNVGLFFAKLGTTNASEVFTCTVANSNGFTSCVTGVYSGTATAWDVALAGANNTTTTSFTSGTTTATANANELGVGVMASTNSTAQVWTGTNGWTFRQQDPGPGVIALFDKVLSATGTQTATATTNFSESGVGVVSTIR